MKRSPFSGQLTARNGLTFRTIGYHLVLLRQVVSRTGNSFVFVVHY